MLNHSFYTFLGTGLCTGQEGLAQQGDTAWNSSRGPRMPPVCLMTYNSNWHRLDLPEHLAEHFASLWLGLCTTNSKQRGFPAVNFIVSWPHVCLHELVGSVCFSIIIAWLGFSIDWRNSMERQF